MLRRGAAAAHFGGYVRAVLSAVMIVLGLLLITIAFAADIGTPN